jgi:hypothetical protein
MPTQHPRLYIVIEEPLYQSISRLARRDGVSMSFKARDLIREALELQEDVHWEKVAESRSKTFHPRTALSHKDVWRSRG